MSQAAIAAIPFDSQSKRLYYQMLTGEAATGFPG
jgi:hypothetical protein